MKKILNAVVVFMLILGFCLYFSGTAAAGKAVVIEGTLNDNLELVTDDGDTYEIGENDMIDSLFKLKGKRLKVQANLDDDYDYVILVKSFDVLEE